MAIYGCVIGGTIIVFFYGIHLINSHNTDFWAAQLKLSHDRFGGAQDRLDKISQELEELKAKQALGILLSKDISRHDSSS